VAAEATPSSAFHEISTRNKHKKEKIMTILAIVIAVIAIVLLFTGGFVSSLNFLLWVGIALLVIAAIVFLLRYISGNRRV
jgi:uncharacterized membrane protein HdeD (DUF308 family)